MRVPTTGETYAKISEYLIKLQEECAMMSHLLAANDDERTAEAWLVVSENFKKMRNSLIKLAMKGRH